MFLNIVMSFNGTNTHMIQCNLENNCIESISIATILSLFICFSCCCILRYRLEIYRVRTRYSPQFYQTNNTNTVGNNVTIEIIPESQKVDEDPS